MATDSRQKWLRPEWWKNTVSIAPLATFRALFGLLLFISVIRFAGNGWIKSQYIDPEFFFAWPGLQWFSNLALTGGPWLLYPVFAIMALAALGIALGCFYRYSSIAFFLTFTWVELIDRSNYLNHYYFVSLIALLLIFLPAHRNFSLDSLRKPEIRTGHIPRWIALIIPAQISLVYIFAGLAKLNPDWMLHAMPMQIWLPAHTHLPLIGELFAYRETAFAFSWMGAFYDLTIPFFLIWSSTRIPAFLAVVAFHLMTAVLFPVGMFPWIMICASTVFFSAEAHLKFQQKLVRFPKADAAQLHSTVISRFKPFQLAPGLMVCWFILQLIIPVRSHFYDGNVKWNEKGYRFSWRVMLMEKAGHAEFTAKDVATGASSGISPSTWLTPQQEKMMATQPDMIVQFASFLHSHQKEGTAVYADSWVSLNGKRSRRFIDPDVDLARVKPANAWKYVLSPSSEKIVQR